MENTGISNCALLNRYRKLIYQRQEYYIQYQIAEKQGRSRTADLNVNRMKAIEVELDEIAHVILWRMSGDDKTTFSQSMTSFQAWTMNPQTTALMQTDERDQARMVQ